jgi:glycosyltransferase involved in cell wall biosynthesis
MDLDASVLECCPRVDLTDRPLTVALVCTQRLWHGGEEQAWLLADGLRRRGHDCKILARHGSPFARRLAAGEFEVVEFSGRGRSPRGLWQIRRALLQWRPDVLHLNDPHALTAGGLAALGLSIPLRVAARRVDFPLNSPTRYRYLSDVVVCVSQAVRQICLRAGLDPHRLHVVADGVEPARMHQGSAARGRRSLGVASDTTVLLTVAKLTSHKGHRYLLDALPAIVRQRPDVIWALAGDGPLAGALRAQVQLLGLQDHVRFLGYRDDVPDLMAAANLLVVPSQMEGLCSSIVDAMLAGVPVVATRAGGIPDLLDESEPWGPAVGWLVPPCDPTALARSVLDALRLTSDTSRLRDMARQRAEREFTAERMVERTIDVYRAALAARAGCVPTGSPTAA